MSSTSQKAEGSQPDTHQPESTAKRRKRPVFYVIAVLLGLSPLLILEAGLRVFGIAEDTAATDLHDGFDKGASLFLPSDDGTTLTTDIGRERFFVRQSFAATKPDDEYRIFVLGGSTVQGRPYLPDTSFGTWLGRELDLANPTVRHNVINCGGISYASYRLRPILNEVLNYSPDLIVLATGHNEFLEDRTYSELKSRSSTRMWIENSARSLRTVMLLRKLTGGAARTEPTSDSDSGSRTLETRLDDPSGYASYHRDDQWHNDVASQFEDAVGDMIASCIQTDVPLVLVKLGGNLRDCPPFKSEHRDGLSVTDQQAWRELFDQAGTVDSRDPEAALLLYRHAQEIDDQYALLHFRIARCLDQLDRFQEAAIAYQSARDLDVCPLRMNSEIAGRLDGFADTDGLHFVDVDGPVTQASPNQISGYESYIDHVHPTISVHQLMGRLIAEELIRSDRINGTLATNTRRLRMRRTCMSRLNANYYSNGRRRIGWLEGWAQRNRLQDEAMPSAPEGYLRSAGRKIDLHRFDDAESDLSIFLDFDDQPDATIDRLALRLFQQGRTADARWLLELLEDQPPAGSETRLPIGLLVLALVEDDRSKLATICERFGIEESGISGYLARDRTGWASAAGLNQVNGDSTDRL